MATMISPSSKVIFDAVSAVETPTGPVQKAPTNDEEWDNVRNNAKVLVEAPICS